MASTVVLSAALCLTATGTAQAVPGSFTCSLTSYNPVDGLVTSALCMGGPGNATSGTITDNTTNALYQCGRLDVSQFGSFFYRVIGFQCTPV